MKYSKLASIAIAAVAAFAGLLARADNMVTINIAPATGEVSLTPRWATGPNLSGFHHMAQDLSLGGGANQFYSIKGSPIPPGGDISAFTRYIAASGDATNHSDIGSKLTPNAYSALTSADPDLGYGSVQLYFIHHKDDGDYFAHIVPSSGTASMVADLKPMSQPGGPSTGGEKGYFGLTFAAANLGYGSNIFYYLRSDTVTGITQFGTLIPSLAGASADQFDLGTGGHNSLVFTGDDVGYGGGKMYFLRLDPITGYTILGTLDPLSGRYDDISNLGSVYSALTYVPGDLGYGIKQFYTTGSVNPGFQTISFAAIDDRLIGAGSFTVAPSASSGLPVTLTVVSGSTGSASITGPIAGVFTVTPTAPGVITLQATQAGQLAPVVYEYNMLRQSFTATGATLLHITSHPASQTKVEGNSATFSVSAIGSSTLSYQWRKAGVAILGNPSATTATLTLPGVSMLDAGSYDVVVTNLSGSIVSDPATLTVTAAPPSITSGTTAGGTVGTAFSYTITASGSPISYSASPLPAGLVINTATGAITGIPTTVGVTNVLLGATNATGTGNATLTITVSAAAVAPTITSGTTAGGTVGTAFNYAITASGSPTSFSAAPLPAGLVINTVTGAITGTPTTVGVTNVLLGATNATGTGNATLTITVSAAAVAPIITSGTTAGGTVGTAFNYAITASGSPTSFSAAPLPAGLVINTVTGAITGIPTTVGVTNVLLGATNATGTGNATLTITVSAAAVAPIITSGTTAGGTVGTVFNYTITASGSPISFSAAPLPAGLVINTVTGAITGIPTTPGVTDVLLGATNATGTGNATLTITVAAAAVAPTITSGTTAGGTVGTAFNYTITASGSPTSFSAAPLPDGLVINPVTGVITGIPTTVGVTNVLLGATNATGTGNATLTITVIAAPVAPTITSPLTADGTLRLQFSYTITASGLPTSFSTSALPAGLTLDPDTGVISGIPTIKAATSVTIRATNAVGTGTAILDINVSDVIRVTVRGPLGAVIYLTPGGALPPAGTTYSIKGLPAGFVLDPVTGRVTTPSVVTAKPGVYRVTYVAITTDSEGNVTRGPATTFIITVDPLLQAMSGGFEAILDDSPATGLPIGKVAIVVNRQTGAYTGTLIHLDSPKVYNLKGFLTLDTTYEAGTGSVTISRGALDPVRVNLAFDTNAVAGQVFVTSLDQLNGGGVFVSTLGRSETGTQLATFTQASPAAWRGNYTLTLDDPDFPPLNLGTEAAPEGAGSGLVGIDSVGGRMVFKGKLGDGAPLSASLAPGADGSYRWYVKPYKTGGYFGGRIRYTPVAGTTARYQVTGPVGSELYWAKNPAPASGNHRAGFGPIAITATSERWIVPTTRDALRVALGLQGNSVVVTFDSAGLTQAELDSLPTTQALNAKNLVLIGDATAQITYARGRKVAGNFRPNGLFTATFTLPDSRKVSVSGALLQNPSVVAGTVIGEGYFVVPPIVKGDEQIQGLIQFLAP